MKPSHFCRLIVVWAAFGFVSPLVYAQGVLPDQIYGSEAANSLVPGHPRRGREKTEQVDTKKLPTKSVTDIRFQGSLLDMGLGSTADAKSHEEKPRSGSDNDSKVSRSTDAGGDKDLKASKPADAGDNKDSKVSKSTDPGGDGHNKDQKATSSRSNEKASGSSTEKASASKADGTP
jgi:hypothetical protein